MLNIMGKFYGRKKEINEITKVFNDHQKLGAKLIGIKGRRRVGKSFLVECFMDNQDGVKLNFIATKQGGTLKNLKQNIFLLKRQMEKQKPEWSIKYTNIKTWLDFFLKIKDVADTCQKENETLMVFLDEINWFSKKDNFYEDFAFIWNSQLVYCQNLVLFFAGSSASWINSHFFKNTAEFYGRLDLKIDLKPFTLIEVAKILKQKEPFIKEEDIINYYLMFGGIIKYYELLDLKKTFEENITKILKEDWKKIKDEKEILFDSLFSLKRSHQDVINQLASSKSLTQMELLKKVNRKNVQLNTLIEDLNELELNDLVRIEDKSYGKTCTIIDLFSYFFYYWFNGKKEAFSFENSDFRTWKGFALEFLIFSQFDEFFEGKNVKINVKTEKNEKHYQIDLTSEKGYGTLVYEIKNYKNEMEISLNDLSYFEEKMMSVNNPNGFVLVTLNGSKLLSKIQKKDFTWFEQFCLKDWLAEKLQDR